MIFKEFRYIFIKMLEDNIHGTTFTIYSVLSIQQVEHELRTIVYNKTYQMTITTFNVFCNGIADISFRVQQ